MKKKATFLIDEQVLEKAHELGINISKACENALKLYINALTNANSEITHTQRSFLSEGSFTKESSVGSRGFEPRIASAPGWYP